MNDERDTHHTTRNDHATDTTSRSPGWRRAGLLIGLVTLGLLIGGTTPAAAHWECGGYDDMVYTCPDVHGTETVCWVERPPDEVSFETVRDLSGLIVIPQPSLENPVGMNNLLAQEDHQEDDPEPSGSEQDPDDDTGNDDGQESGGSEHKDPGCHVQTSQGSGRCRAGGSGGVEVFSPGHEEMIVLSPIRTDANVPNSARC